MQRVEEWEIIEEAIKRKLGGFLAYGPQESAALLREKASWGLQDPVKHSWVLDGFASMIPSSIKEKKKKSIYIYLK